MGIEDETTSEPVEITGKRVHDDGYTLSEIKQLLLANQGLFDDITVEELEILWEHEFYNVDENAGDGISNKFFEYSNVTRNGADVEVAEGGFIRTKERGDYGAGKQAIPGFACRWNQEPIADQDGWAGYYLNTDGIGAGIGYKHFTEGENNATEAGPQAYLFYEVGGEGKEIVPQEHWNISALDGSDNLPEFDPLAGTLVRLPHAAYGNGRLVVKVGIKTDAQNADFSYAGDGFKMYSAHVFTRPGETMWDHFDLPIEWNVSGTQGNGFLINATACHYQGDQGRTVKRVSGEGFTPNKNSGSAITLNTYPEWTYLESFKLRDGWDGTDITPLGLSINATENVEVQITIGGDFENTSYGLPNDTGETEAATEYDLKTYDLANDQEKTTETTIGTTNGMREWYGVVAGDKQEPVQITQDVEEVVLSGTDALALLARPATSTSTDIRYTTLRNGSNF